MNATGDGLPRRRDEARALFRNAILDAAEAVFAENGFHGARIQDIAARARIAVGTVYNHFEQKDDVLAALLEERTEEFVECLRGRSDDPRSFGGRLEARVVRMLEAVQKHRAFFAIVNEHGLFAGHAAPGVPAAARPLRQIEKFRAVLRDLVEEGVASGDLESLDPGALTYFLGSTIRAFVLASLGEPPEAASNAALAVDLFLHGAARRRPKRAK